MKYASRKVIQFFPGLQKYIPNHDSVLLGQQTLNNLDDTQQVFLKLVWFFEKPEENNFNLIDLYRNLQDDWLSFALECIVAFFERDTYLLKETDFSIITEDKEYLNQTDFARYLNENGLNYSRQKINIYLSRGTIPNPDLKVGDNKFWLIDTCEEYLSTINDKSKRSSD